VANCQIPVRYLEALGGVVKHAAEAQVPDSCSVTRVESARSNETGLELAVALILRLAGAGGSEAEACVPIMRLAASLFSLLIESYC
jgi:hypothetical protein